MCIYIYISSPNQPVHHFMLNHRLFIVGEVSVVVLHRFPGPEKVSGAPGVSLRDDDVRRIRLPGPEEVAAAGVPGGWFRLLRFPGP
jgi:hypothetical protein